MGWFRLEEDFPIANTDLTLQKTFQILGCRINNKIR